MQSERYRSTNPVTVNRPRAPQTAAQHGNDSCETLPDGHVPGRDDGDGHSATGSVLLSPHPSDDPRLDVDAPEATLGSQHHPEPRTSTRRPSEDVFILGEPVQAQKLGQSPSTRKNGVSFETLPNEVLTHILSHLQPPSLSSMSLVNHRFHDLVTTPHAWRIAFSRYFPGPAIAQKAEGRLEGEDWEHVLLKRRAFCRLTALSSWRNEYILRTRLLHSLARGKPTSYQVVDQRKSTRSDSRPAAHAVVTYNSLLQFPISHLHGTFGSSLESKPPIFVHGAGEEGIATLSDPAARKSGLGKWGLLSESRMFNHFADNYPGEAQWGLGSGTLVGNPNVMDVSQPHGMVYGEGCPQGRVYFLSTGEKRGRFLPSPAVEPQHALGIPALNTTHPSVCATWIAKSTEVLKLTHGLCGMMTGNSSGILTSYALGPHPSYDRRFERGQPTAKWALCPGVPIVSIKVDDHISTKRLLQRKIWLTVLNALGEVFYLTDVPEGPDTHRHLDPESHEIAAWKSGRTVSWEIIEDTRRVPESDPFKKLSNDASYSPRSSAIAMNLSREQLVDETKDIESFLALKPCHFRKVYRGWNMKRKLEVDFAGDDGQGAGESIVVIDCSATPDGAPSVKRFTRVKLNDHAALDSSGDSPSSRATEIKPSLFGQTRSEEVLASSSESLRSPISAVDNDDSSLSARTVEWRVSDLTFGDSKCAEITACALDMSTFARLTKFEDPLLGMCGNSGVSSMSSTPFSVASNPLPSSAEIPGQRARYMAIGTSFGSVYVWDVRAAVPSNTLSANSICPIRIIHTQSPQVSSLALTALYLVHGGNDGLVQAWDHLASSTMPIRTLNSRFSSRARRRLEQAGASNHDVGHNFFAAGAICLDQDPTRLRGIVALGTQLRYWAYSSSAADQYRSSKRRLRHSPRGSNHHAETQRFSNSGRGAIMDYIMNEKAELEREKIEKEKEAARFSGRFGTDILGPGATEEDILAYACLLSEESYTSDERNRRGSESSSAGSSSSETVASNETFNANSLARQASTPALQTVDEELEAGIAEAIRRSLQDSSEASQYESGTSVGDDSISYHLSPFSSPGLGATPPQTGADDLELAIQLSLAEHRDPAEPSSPQEEFPSLGSASSTPSKRKGKKRV